MAVISIDLPTSIQVSGHRTVTVRLQVTRGGRVSFATPRDLARAELKALGTRLDSPLGATMNYKTSDSGGTVGGLEHSKSLLGAGGEVAVRRAGNTPNGRMVTASTSASDVEAEIERTRQRVRGSLRQLRDELSAMTNWRTQVGRHPWTCMAGALGLGVVFGRLIGGNPKRRMEAWR